MPHICPPQHAAAPARMEGEAQMVGALPFQSCNMAWTGFSSLLRTSAAQSQSTRLSCLMQRPRELPVLAGVLLLLLLQLLEDLPRNINLLCTLAALAKAKGICTHLGVGACSVMVLKKLGTELSTEFRNTIALLQKENLKVIIEPHEHEAWVRMCPLIKPLAYCSNPFSKFIHAGGQANSQLHSVEMPSRLKCC